MRELARLFQLTDKQLAGAFRELLGNAVVILKDGVIVCPRVVADTAKSLKGKEYGKRGGNPMLRVVDNPGVNPEGYTQKSEVRYQNPQSLSQGRKGDDLKAAEKKLYEAAEKKLRAAYDSWADMPNVVENYRDALRRNLGSHAPPEKASFLPVLRLVIEGLDPVTGILIPARDKIAAKLPQGYEISSWSFYTSKLSSNSEDREAS
jgi:hypothetical protein